MNNNFREENIFLTVIGPILDLGKLAEVPSEKLPEMLAKVVLTNRLKYSDMESVIFIGSDETEVLDFCFDYYKPFNFMPYSIVSLSSLNRVKESFLAMKDDDVILLDEHSDNIFFVETVSSENKVIPYIVKSDCKNEVSNFFAIKRERVVTFYDKKNLYQTINSLNQVKDGKNGNYYFAK